MIKIDISRDDQNNIVEFSIKGHADFAPHGEDIVCASISILSQTTILALNELLSINLEYCMEEGYLSCKLPNLTNEIREKANLILNTMLIGIKGTRGMYNKYIDLNDKEV